MAPAGLELPSMTGAVLGLVEAPPVRIEHDTVHHDTAALALTRAGVTLSRADGPEPSWVVRLPDLEVRFDGTADAVPTPARDAVRAYVRAHRLRAVARLHSDRTTTALLAADGTHRADLVDDLMDDLVLGPRTDEPTVTTREVRLVMTDHGDSGRLQRAVVRRLVDAGCRTEPSPSRLVRLLGGAAGRPADVVVPPLTARPTAAEAISLTLALSVDRLVRHDAGVRLVDDDPEPVHQLRVAARRLRSHLKTFRSALDREWADPLRDELRWLGGVAGELRDLDVLGARLRRAARHADEADAAAVEALLERLAHQRAHARRTTLAALRTHRYDALLEALVDAARSPRLADGATGASSARRLLRRAARTQVRRLDRAVAASTAPFGDADVHGVRIQAKHTRYAIEAATPVVGTRAAEHAVAIAALQDVLGDLHDSLVLAQWLRRSATAHPTSGLAAGELIAAEHAQQARLRASARRRWEAASDDRLRTWL